MTIFPRSLVLKRIIRRETRGITDLSLADEVGVPTLGLRAVAVEEEPGVNRRGRWEGKEWEGGGDPFGWEGGGRSKPLGYGRVGGGVRHLGCTYPMGW